MNTAEIERRTYGAGQELELAPSYLWQLLDGEVIVAAGNRPVDLWRAPRALNAVGFARGASEARFHAATDVVVQGRPQVSTEELATLLAEEAEALWRRVDADARRDDDTFLEWAMPVPGPWHFRRATAFALIVQGDPERIRACMPRGVRPLPGCDGRYVLALTRFEGVGSLDVRDPSQFTYHEVTPFLPAWSGWRGPAAYIPELYADAWMAMLLGREIHGFPKRTARIGFDDDGGHLIVDRKLSLRVRCEVGDAVDPDLALSQLAEGLMDSERAGRASHRLLELLSDDVEKRFSAIVHKRIGSPKSAGRRLEIDDVVRVPILLDPIRSARPLHDLDVDLAGGPGILHGQVVAGWRLTTGFRFGRGRVERHRGTR